jgi:hypothetical protein
MREETLRNILLARAIEEADADGRLVPLADREAATREARREVAMASRRATTAPGAGMEEALAVRAQRLIQPLLQRQPALARLALPVVVPWWAVVALLVAAFASGLGLAALDGSRRINILALPIVGVVAWNLAVYLVLGLAALRRGFGADAKPAAEGEGWLGRVAGRRLDRLFAAGTEVVPPLGDALSRFAVDLGHALVPLFARHLRRSLHLAAAGLAMGLLAGLYLRGIVFRFEAGWESTFLGPRQVLGLIRLLFAPVAAWAGVTLPQSVQDVDALRWTAAGGGGDAAPWIHLIALCLLLYVIVPRLVLAVVASFDVLRLRRSVAMPPQLVAYARSLFGTEGPLFAESPSSVVSFSLISHTNAGKTTLARTLLRRDVGEVRDAPHVTTEVTAYELIATAQGDVLQLWDTPGFGGTERLATRLRQTANPVGWITSQVWDRITDRDFFLSQRAVRNLRDTTDVVLYVVDASEDPATASYLDAEMGILGWIGKPVLVLLNQIGARHGAALEKDARAQAWQEHLGRYPWVRAVLGFDAFARCWVQEHTLLEQIAALLPAQKQRVFDRVAVRWRERNTEVFDRSMQVLAAQLAAAAEDVAVVGHRGLGETARAWLGGGERTDLALDRATDELGARLDAEVRRSTDELIRLHGLSGQASAEVLARMGTEFAVSRAADLGKASVLGGAVTGALGGLAADLAAGGLTFGAGALIGGLIGAAGARGAAKAYNLARGVDTSTVRWSPEFLGGRVVAAITRYLAVAHFGRGRGEFAQDEYPGHWRAVVEAAVESRRPRLEEAWSIATRGSTSGDVERRLTPLVSEIADEVLRVLYPGHTLRQ